MAAARGRSRRISACAAEEGSPRARTIWPRRSARASGLGQTRGGYTVGAGAEYKWGNWIGRLEYRYSEFQNWTPTFFGRTGDDIYTDISVRTHMVNVGVAYLFNWGGPVVARY